MVGWDKMRGGVGAIQCSPCPMGGPLFLLQPWGVGIKIVVFTDKTSLLNVKFVTNMTV